MPRAIPLNQFYRVLQLCVSYAAGVPLWSYKVLHKFYLLNAVLCRFHDYFTLLSCSFTVFFSYNPLLRPICVLLPELLCLHYRPLSHATLCGPSRGTTYNLYDHSYISRKLLPNSFDNIWSSKWSSTSAFPLLLTRTTIWLNCQD